MAPVLFLFLMTAFAESLEVVRKCNNIKVVTLKSVTEEDFVQGKGAIKSHTIAQYQARSLIAVAIIQCMYVDECAFIFESRNGIEKGANFTYDHFVRFGLEMHIGDETTDSKTKCVYPPPPQFFEDSDFSPRSIRNSEETDEYGLEDTQLIPEEQHTQQEHEQKKSERGDEIYDALEQTRPIQVAEGRVTFTKHFKYLGSYVSYNLRDDYDIETRLAKASQSMGALSSFWNNPHVGINSKYLLFRAIPINLLADSLEQT
ncbi:hypothetical protein ACHAWF_016100 [Thalassiosira exigua]